MRQRGVAVIETAIVLPLLLLLFVAVGELGRVFIQYSRLSHRVHAAARHVAENALQGTTGVPALSQQLLTEARNLVIFGGPTATGAPAVPGLNPNDIAVSVDTAGVVRVQLAYVYQPTVGIGGAIAIDALTLRPQTTLRAL